MCATLAPAAGKTATTMVLQSWTPDYKWKYKQKYKYKQFTVKLLPPWQKTTAATPALHFRSDAHVKREDKFFVCPVQFFPQRKPEYSPGYMAPSHLWLGSKEIYWHQRTKQKPHIREIDKMLELDQPAWRRRWWWWRSRRWRCPRAPRPPCCCAWTCSSSSAKSPGTSSPPPWRGPTFSFLPWLIWKQLIFGQW